MKIIKITGLQIFWYFSIVYGSNIYVPILGAILYAIDFLVFRKRNHLDHKYLIFSFILILSGFLLDMGISAFNIMSWNDAFYPTELVGVWLIFPTYYYHFFKKFKSKSWVSFIVGAIFGPFAYYSGSRINPSISLHFDIGDLVVLCIVWGLFFMTSIHLFFQLVSKNKD